MTESSASLSVMKTPALCCKVQGAHTALAWELLYFSNDQAKVNYIKNITSIQYSLLLFLLLF